MADQDDRPVRRRRPEREESRSGSAPPARPRRRPEEDADARTRNGHKDGVLPVAAARRAAEQIVMLTGRELESVVSIEADGDGWLIGVEVVETRRIPDSADILALFEVQVDADGDLTGYRRAARYGRGTLHEGGR